MISVLARGQSSTEAYVYFVRMQVSGHIKIGSSLNPTARLRKLQTGANEPLEPLAIMPGGRELEHMLHRRFQDARVHGEWFRATPEIQAFIASEAEPWAENRTLWWDLRWVQLDQMIASLSAQRDRLNTEITALNEVRRLRERYPESLTPSDAVRLAKP